jgi:hypothetical protein
MPLVGMSLTSRSVLSGSPLILIGTGHVVAVGYVI